MSPFTDRLCRFQACKSARAHFEFIVTADKNRINVLPWNRKILLPILHNQCQRPSSQFGLTPPHGEDLQSAPSITHNVWHGHEPAKVTLRPMPFHESEEQVWVKFTERAIVDAEVSFRMLGLPVCLRRKQLLHFAAKFLGAIVEPLGRVEHHNHRT